MFERHNKHCRRALLCQKSLFLVSCADKFHESAIEPFSDKAKLKLTETVRVESVFLTYSLMRQNVGDSSVSVLISRVEGGRGRCNIRSSARLIAFGRPW